MPQFQVTAIPLEDVRHFLTMDDQALANAGMQRLTVDTHPGYPCRLSLEDAQVGEQVLAFSYCHHPAASPYRASGPVFVRTDAAQAKLAPNVIPDMLLHRLLSLRVYDPGGMMIDAHTLEGIELAERIQAIFADDQAAYIQVHNAGPGCFNCQIDRVTT